MPDKRTNIKLILLNSLYMLYIFYRMTIDRMFLPNGLLVVGIVLLCCSGVFLGIKKMEPKKFYRTWYETRGFVKFRDFLFVSNGREKYNEYEFRKTQLELRVIPNLTSSLADRLKYKI